MPLQDLRRNPEQSLSTEAFFVEPFVLNYDSPLGFSATFEEKVVNTVNYLKVRNDVGGRDFYFPWKHNYAAHVGVTNPRDGCIVTTAGMNGCALEVRYNRGTYYFYHDDGGRCMNTANNQHPTICRITENSYLNINALHQGIQMGVNTIYQFICVYLNYSWHVGCMFFFIEEILFLKIWKLSGDLYLKMEVTMGYLII